jgi:hypothetical protein
MKVFYLSWNGSNSHHCQQNKFAVMMMLLVRQKNWFGLVVHSYLHEWYRYRKIYLLFILWTVE